MNKLAENGNKKARSVLKFVENESQFLSTIQIGVTLAGFLSSAFAADSFADMLVSALSGRINIPDKVIQTVSVILITVLLSYFSLIFGELVPKRYAMKYSDKLALNAVRPLMVIEKILSPFIFLLTQSVNIVLRLIGINPHEEDEAASEEEILYLVNESEEQGVIDEEEKELITNVFEFDDIKAEDIMVKNENVVSIPKNASFKDIMRITSDAGFSRYPVYESKKSNIVGTLYIKDLIKYNSKNFDINKILRKPCLVPCEQKIDIIFKMLNKRKSHIGIVLDNNGKAEGIITMEDILEELVGNITDEYDTE